MCAATVENREHIETLVAEALRSRRSSMTDPKSTLVALVKEKGVRSACNEKAVSKSCMYKFLRETHPELLREYKRKKLVNRPVTAFDPNACYTLYKAVGNLRQTAELLDSNVVTLRKVLKQADGFAPEKRGRRRKSACA